MSDLVSILCLIGSLLWMIAGIWQIWDLWGRWKRRTA